MSQIFRRIVRNSQYLINKSPKAGSVRTFSDTYEGDGKTKVNILNNDFELGLLINSYSEVGFRLNNELKVLGPMAIFPRSVLSWNVGHSSDINEASLSLFCALEPKIEILVLGIGDDKVTPQLSKRLLAIMKKHQINLEILPTQQACTTFNFLNAESRMVAGAFIPPRNILFDDEDVISTQARHNELYQSDQMFITK